jgi:hypothetical protein
VLLAGAFLNSDGGSKEGGVGGSGMGLLFKKQMNRMIRSFINM